MTPCKVHALKDILFGRPDSCGAQAVVRWCERCGAIVIDNDKDGRTKPGESMKMKFPKLMTE
jgi:hypothetical protein